MTKVFEAVYEKGIFRPVAPVGPSLTEGQHVRIVVESNSPEEILHMAAAVYEGLSPQDADYVEQIALDRSNFFTRPSD